MAEVIHPAHGEVHRHEPPSGFIRKYIFSVDHKVIGIQYYFLALFSVFLGMGLSVLMRLQLGWPDQQFGFLKVLFPNAAESGTITPEMYLSLVTMHGTIMVFFVLTTAPQGGFGNYFLPIQIGAADMAFPVLNMLSFWVTFLALVVMIFAIYASVFDPTAAVGVVGPIGGWTGLRAVERAGRSGRAGAGDRRRLLGDEHRAVLHSVATGRAEFHHDDAEPARARDVADAVAADVLGAGLRRLCLRCCLSLCCWRRASCCCSTTWPGRASSSPATNTSTAS